MKNPKYFVAFMIGILFVVSLIIRSGENIGEDLQKNRLGADVGLNMKSNTFTVPYKAPPKPSAPQWGSFKSQPVEVAVAKEGDKTQDLLKTIAKKAADKLKDEKKKKKLAKNKRPKFKLINSASDSRVARAMRNLDDGFGKDAQPIVAGAFAPQAEAQNQNQPEEENVRSLQEWQALLLNASNPSAADELIQAYQNDSLGQREWAFVLAEEMIEHSSPEVRSNGLKILNSIPSEQSFAILAKHKDQYAEPEMNRDITHAMSAYSSNLGHLSYLERAVMSNELVVQREAARAIDKSASDHLTANGRGRRNPQPTSTTPRERFTSTLLVLNSASQKTTDVDTKREIDLAITGVTEKLGSSRQSSLEIPR